MKRTALQVIAITTLLLGLGSQAMIVAVDINDTAAMSGVGVLATSGAQWTVTDAATGSALIDTDGNVTSVGFATTAFGLDAGGTAGNNVVDDYGFYTADGGAFTLTIDGLDPNTPYKLVLYGAQQVSTRGTTWSIDGDIKVSDANDFSNGGFVEGSTYVLYSRVLADDFGEINIDGTPEATFTASFLNGFEIQAIPEPSTIAVLGLSLLLLRQRACRHATRS